MRIVIDLPTPIAKQVFVAMERGDFPSVDDLAAAAFSQFLVGQSDSERRIQGLDVDQDESWRALLASPLTDGPTASQQGSDDAGGWMWGMVNRVFPLKLAVRVCSNMCSQGPARLQSVQTQVAECGVRIGAMLTADDKEHGRKRNECRAVGLPAAERGQKSSLRFAFHFLGRQLADGSFGGGCFDTGLLGPMNGKAQLISPTEAGWELSKLPNPVLDCVAMGTEIKGVANLSDAESEFYLSNVASSVPAERRAFAAILEALEDGPLTSAALADAVSPYIPPGRSDSVVATTRSGAIGRLVDLKAIMREPTGRSAMLGITDRGSAFLRRAAGSDVLV